MTCCCGTRTAVVADGPLAIQTSCAGTTRAPAGHCNDFTGTGCPMTLPCNPAETP